MSLWQLLLALLLLPLFEGGAVITKAQRPQAQFHWFPAGEVAEALEGKTVVFTPPLYTACVIPRAEGLPLASDRFRVRNVKSEFNYKLPKYTAYRKDFELDFKFPFYGKEYAKMWINTGGFISLTNSLTNDPDKVKNFPVVNVARLGAEHSWEQDERYQIWWKQFEDRAVVTFDGTLLYSKDAPSWIDGPPSIFQAELFANGTVALTYVKVDVKSAMNVGVKPGSYASPETNDWWRAGGSKSCSGPWTDPGPPAPGSWFSYSRAKQLLEGNSVIFSPPDYSPCVIERESWPDPDPNNFFVKQSVKYSPNYKMSRYSSFYNYFQDNFTFPFYGTNYKMFYTTTLGSVAPANEPLSNTQAVYNILPQIDVMNPEHPQMTFDEVRKYQIWWKQLPDRAVVGFSDVPTYVYNSFEDSPSTFTVELLWNGTIVMNFMDTNVVLGRSKIHVGVRPPNAGVDSVDWWPEGRPTKNLHCKPRKPAAAAKADPPPTVAPCPDGSAKKLESCVQEPWCDVLGMRSRATCANNKEFIVRNRCESGNTVYAAAMQDGVVHGWFCIPADRDINTIINYSKTYSDIFYTLKTACGPQPGFAELVNHQECVMVGSEEVCDWRRFTPNRRWAFAQTTLSDC